MEKVKSDSDALKQNVFDVMKATNDFFMREFIESLRQKNLWVAKVVTIASAILGGLLLSQQPENLVINLGLSLLFVVIFVGLILIYRGNKKLTDGLIEVYGKSTDYSIKLLLYLALSDKQVLTAEEQKEKVEIEEYLNNSLQKMGIINEDGAIGSVYEKLSHDAKIDWANYLLIIGFFIAGLILTFSNYIASYLGLETVASSDVDVVFHYIFK